MKHLTIFTVRSPYDSHDGLYSYGILTENQLTRDMFMDLYSEWEHMPVIKDDGMHTYLLDPDQKQDFCELCDCDDSIWNKFNEIFGYNFDTFFEGYTTEDGKNWIATLYELSLKAAADLVLKDTPHEVIRADHIYDCHMIDF